MGVLGSSGVAGILVTGGGTGGVTTGRLTGGGVEEVFPSPSPQAESRIDTTPMLSDFTRYAVVFFKLLP